jgi:hypothetical protein
MNAAQRRKAHINDLCGRISGVRAASAQRQVRLAAAGRLRTAVALELVAGQVWALPKFLKDPSRRFRSGTSPRSTC